MNKSIVYNRKAVKNWLVILVAGLSMLATGCASNDTPVKENLATATSEAKPPEKLTIALDWYPNAVHSFLYAAESQGYFRDENLQVELKMPSDASDPLKLAATDKVDMAISYQTQAIVAKAEGLPIKSLAAIVREPLNVLMVREDSTVLTPKDLSDKNVGYPALPLDIEIVKHMVQTDGGDPSNIRFTDIGFQLIPALSTKQTDATIGGFINHEQVILEKNNVPVRLFRLTDYGVPSYYELVLVTSDQTAAKKREALERFQQAIQKGQAHVASHPKEALEALLQHEAAEFPLDREIEHKSLEVLLPLMDAKGQAFGSQDTAQWQEVIDWMAAKKLISKTFSAQEILPVAK
ncbi:ABC transporter substrate-binding protein [Brevibacillus laterosporus]|uniref:ABC transporter substrate-binding protein n=2 Tax=Brevibacillus TaxID=55080 RepID=A0ABT4HVH6_9BACL|nr:MULTISPECIES: ABC transporter substrate-binding protein [Brevibacillus]MCR8985077.1 ABC transporter substrate-binding protein [Brevibacillus laterosporus]MCZ0830806.1 ABC transporter substrate-binding protein [Brevibacillus halotolerans]